MPYKILLLVFLAAFTLQGCGGDDFSCPEFCASVRDKILDQMPDITPEDINCLDPEFVNAGNDCEACMEIFAERWDISITDSQCSD
jgi:hypothetical protein